MAVDEDTGIQVSVQVDGAGLPEYEPPESTGNDPAGPVITKYIESHDDAVFTILIIADVPYDWGKGELDESALCIHVSIDGQSVAHPCLYHRYPATRVATTETLDSDGKWVKKNFQFTSISTVEDSLKERVERDKARAETLGKIEVRFERGHIGGALRTASDRAIKTSGMVLSEKSLKGKGISHGTTYGEARAISVPKRCTYARLGKDPDPVPSFIFLYRSKEALKNELIIPRSPPTLSPILDAKPEKGKLSLKRDSETFYDLTQDSSHEKPSKLARVVPGGEVELIDLTVE